MLDAPGALPLLVALMVVAAAVLLRLRQVDRDVLARTQGAVARARAELEALEADIVARRRDRDELARASSAREVAEQELARLRDDVARTRAELDASAALLAEQRAAIAAATPVPVRAPARGPARVPTTAVSSGPRSGVDLAAVRAASGAGEAPLRGVVHAVRPDEPVPAVDVSRPGEGS